MRRYVVCALGAVGALAACSPVTDGPTGPAPSFIAVGPGQGNSPDRIRIRDQRREDFTLTVIGCINEPLVVTGRANFITQAQDNPADRVHFRLHTNLQGVSGVGQTTGTRYRLAEEFNATYNYVFLESPKLETTQIYRFRLTGDGPNNNSWINISFHLTITPDGTIASSFTRAEARCAEDGAS
jgi:hypothetical protein